MKSILLIICISFLLTACGTTSPILTQEKLGKINVSKDLFECPVIKTFPNPEKLTDIQVAKLIVKLYHNNQKCKISINGIEQFIEHYNSMVDQ